LEKASSFVFLLSSLKESFCLFAHVNGGIAAIERHAPLSERESGACLSIMRLFIADFIINMPLVSTTRIASHQTC
jgi:hypothetical protein